jgi:hypothetical protein
MAEVGMRTEQEVLAFLYRKRDGALSAASRVVYAEAISAIEGDLLGDPNEPSTPMIVLSSAIAMPLLPIIGDAPAVATCGPLFGTGGISLPNAVHQQIRSKECR